MPIPNILHEVVTYFKSFVHMCGKVNRATNYCTAQPQLHWFHSWVVSLRHWLNTFADRKTARIFLLVIESCQECLLNSRTMSYVFLGFSFRSIRSYFESTHMICHYIGVKCATKSDLFLTARTPIQKNCIIRHSETDSSFTPDNSPLL